ncbi:armadillo-type protein [Syncephalis fuscata]|nr:armadillo-type protein [Syncephalis fuscata]
METAVCQLLAQSTVADPNVRVQAELELRRMETTLPDYAAVLLRCSMETGVEDYNYIDGHWSHEAEHFTAPEPSDQVKAMIREGSLVGLADTERNIRTAFASVVAKIAHQDWPEQWPNLLESLVQLLRDGSADQAHGVLICLYEILQVDVVEQQISAIVPILSDELLRVIRSDEIYPTMTRARAIKVFRTCLEALYTVKETQQDQVHRIIEAIVPYWLEGFFHVLALQNADETSVLLKLESIRTLSVMVQSFAGNMKDRLAKIIEVVWADLKRHQELYPFIVESAKDDSPMTWTGQGEDGDATGFATLLIAELEFEHQCVRKKTASAFYEQVDEQGNSLLAQVMPLLITFMQITMEQAEAWLEDATRFIQDEDEDSFNASVRASAFDLFQSLLTRYETPTLQAMLFTCNQIFTTSTTANQTPGHNDWWRAEEACFAAIGLASDIIIDKLAQLAPLQFAHQDLFTELIPNRCQQKNYPFLQSRVLLVSSLFTDQYSTAMAGELVQVMVSLLKDGASIPVRVSAMKALNSYSQLDNKSIVGPYREFVVSDAMQLIKDASGETLQLVLETLFAFLKAGELSPQPIGIVCTTLLETWTRYPNDHICASVIEDIYDLLWSNETVAPMVFTASEPFFIQIFSQHEQQQQHSTEAVLFGLNLITQLAKRRPSSLTGECLARVFPLLLSTLLTSQHPQVMQQGAQCLSQLLLWDSLFIINWQDAGSGQRGVDGLLQYISRLLDPVVSEAAGSTVGHLIIQLLQKARDQVNESLPILLQAVMIRLTMSETATQIQSLVMVFAELIRSQTKVTIDFLHATTASQGVTGMQLLLSKWCENHPYFHGYFSIKMSIYALSILLANMDDRLSQVQLKGDLMPSTDGRIVTRSRSKSHPDQYTVVPAPVKIMKLLLAELQTDEAPRPTGSVIGSDNEEEDEDEEGEWEDLEEEMGPSFDFISDLLTSTGDDLNVNNEDDEDEDDGVDAVERRKDPVYIMNIKEHLIGLFKSFAQSNPVVLTDMAQRLTPQEQSLLQSILV